MSVDINDDGQTEAEKITVIKGAADLTTVKSVSVYNAENSIPSIWFYPDCKAQSVSVASVSNQMSRGAKPVESLPDINKSTYDLPSPSPPLPPLCLS